MQNKPIIVYTSKARIHNKKELIQNPPCLFDETFWSIFPQLNEVDRNFLLELDKAEVIHHNGQWGICTPFGITDPTHLSNGCKTALLANHTKDKIISLKFCGMNAIVAILKNAQAAQNEYLAGHANFNFDQGEYPEIRVKVNNMDMCSLRELCSIMV